MNPSATNDIVSRRLRLQDRLFPAGVPRLWCAPLTHYTQDGAIDATRIRAHLGYLSCWVKGFLVPGSTGDGWEMNPQEVREVLDIFIDEAQKLGVQVLIGALKTDEREVLGTIRDTLEWLQTRTSPPGAAASLLPASVCGFTVCAPRGSQRSQEEIGAALTAILELGLPTAVYQLPQVTLNEIAPETLSALAMRYENFILFKDSSGTDNAVLSGKPLGRVFTLRGGEGDYARWFSLAGGPYDGFLLGSANCFAAALDQMIQDIVAGRTEAAQRVSEQVTAVVTEVSRSVAGLPDGNAFANANKAIEHFFAWGPRAAEVPPPRLHGGSRLAVDIIRQAGESLSRHGLMPATPYL